MSPPQDLWPPLWPCVLRQVTLYLTRLLGALPLPIIRTTQVIGTTNRDHVLTFLFFCHFTFYHLIFAVHTPLKWPHFANTGIITVTDDTATGYRTVHRTFSLGVLTSSKYGLTLTPESLISTTNALTNTFPYKPSEITLTSLLTR